MAWTCIGCSRVNESNARNCIECDREHRPFSTCQRQNDVLDYDNDGVSNVSEKSCKKTDMYVRVDGKLLYGQEAVNERKRSIARSKALDLLKRWRSALRKQSNNGNKSLQAFSTNIWRTSSALTSTTASKSISLGHLDAATAHAKGAHASAKATAEKAAISVFNASATGANASVSASASKVDANALNANVTGVTASTSVSARGLNVAAGNVNVTGVDVSTSASASAAQVSVRNVDINGSSIGASLKANGAGIKAGNVAICGPSLSASASVDGSFSFGNVNIGLGLALDIGFGVNIGIPFLSGSNHGSNGSNASNSNNGSNDKVGSSSTTENPSGLEGVQCGLPDNVTNSQCNSKAAEVSLESNTTGEPVDPLLSNDQLQRTADNSSASESNTPSHSVSGDNKSKSVAGSDSAADNISNGVCASPSPEVADGYTCDENGSPGVISRVYLPQNAAKIYYTETGFQSREAKEVLREVKAHSDNRYIFSGPQDLTNPDLYAADTGISPTVRDEAHSEGTLVIEDANTCARDGGCEPLAHVFEGEPPYRYENVPPKQKELSEDDELLLEECRKLGFEIPLSSLDAWKKELRSDAEYEREQYEKERLQQSNNNNNSNNAASTIKEEKDEQNEPPKPCKNHASNIRCMNCLKNSSSTRIRKIHGNIHGFQHRN